MQLSLVSAIALLTLFSESASVDGVFLQSRARRILQQNRPEEIDMMENDINRMTIRHQADDLKFEGCKTQTTNHVAFDQVAVHSDEEQEEPLPEFHCAPSYNHVPDYSCDTWAYPDTLLSFQDKTAPNGAAGYSLKTCKEKCTDLLRCDGIVYTETGDCFMCIMHGGAPSPLSFNKGQATSLYLRNSQQVVLEEDALNAVQTSCCDASSRHCAGCAKLNNAGMPDQTCGRCLGGFQLQSDGTCLMCADVAHWLNDDKQTCTEATCSDTRTRGVSSNMACCACTGGQVKATNFMYPVVNLVLGGGVLPYWNPIPRTARTYSLNKECKFGEFGLQMNGETGLLMLKSGCTSVGCGKPEAFQVSCTLTAHQTPKLNATALISVIAFAFQYASTPLVLFQGQRATPLVVVTSPSMRCTPSSASHWLSLDTDGSLQASQTASDYGGAEVGGITGGPMGHLGASCFVSGTLSTGEQTATYVIVFAPQPWTTIVYDGALGAEVIGLPNLFASLGEEVLPIKTVPPPQDRVKPHRFSMYCEHQTKAQPPFQDAAFVFDTVTGVATLNGHAALTMDPQTGLIQVAPRRSMSEVFDSMHANSFSTIRKTIDLVCRVYGSYAFQSSYHASRVAKSKQFNLQIRDHICWVERTAKFSYAKAPGTSPNNANQCRRLCRENMACSDYGIVDSRCYFYRGVCETGDECLSPEKTVKSKILNCGEQTACINLENKRHQWISGDYCPAGQNIDGPVYQKEGNTIPDTVYLAKWNLDRDGQLAGCSPGKYVLKQADPGKDFIIADVDSIELKGAVIELDGIKCIGNGVEMENVWIHGQSPTTVNSGSQVIARIAGLPCGPVNTTVASVDSTDDSAAEDDEEEGLQVETLVFDDPATSQANDYWIHPCDCFPERWGPKPPVDPVTFEATPAGQNNLYIPAAMFLIEGEFTCEKDTLLELMLLDELEDEEPMTCDEHCQGKPGCQFFFLGEVFGGQQCRLYSKCKRLSREVGLVGELSAKPRGSSDRKFCHIANPELCWATTGRRALLNAHSLTQVAHSHCAYLSTLQQCDTKLLLGGMGVTTCNRCAVKALIGSQEIKGSAFNWKIALPDTFEHGQQLGLSCWSERFRPMPVVGKSAKNEELLTCISGNWRDSSGKLGLSNFACGACIQVVKPGYIQFDARNKQEVYFAGKLKHRIYVSKFQLLRSGGLGTTGAEFQLLDVGSQIQIKPVTDDKCLQTATRSKTTFETLYTFSIFTLASDCDDMDAQQLTSMAALPSILSEVVHFNTPLLNRETHSTTSVFAYEFQALAFNLDCLTFAIGEVRWMADTVLPKKFKLAGACRPAERADNQLIPSATWHEFEFSPKTAEKPLDWACGAASSAEVVSGKGVGYRGCQSLTDSGRTCQNWNKQTPHVIPAMGSGSGLGNHNFCRNPGTSADGVKGKFTTIWCYTRDDEYVNADTESVGGVDKCTPPIAPAPADPEPRSGVTLTAAQRPKACRFGGPERTKSSLLEGTHPMQDTNQMKNMHVALWGKAMGARPTTNIHPNPSYTYLCHDDYSRMSTAGLEYIYDDAAGTTTRKEKIATWKENCKTSYGEGWYADYTSDCTREAPSLELKVARQMASLILSCQAGQAMNHLKKYQKKFFLKCATIAGMGSCFTAFTPQSDITVIQANDVNFLVGLVVQCGKDEALNALVAETSGTAWFRYKYTCCSVAALPMSISPTGFRTDAFSNDEGIYCPSERDVSGRLKFSNVHKFGGGLLEINNYNDYYNRRRTRSPTWTQIPVGSKVVYYDRKHAKWCLSDECVPSVFAHPVETKFPQNSNWVAVGMTDFDAVFEGKGPTPTKAKKRKKPTLIKFGSSKPEYADECKEDVQPGSASFLKEDMKKVALGLPGNNPCSGSRDGGLAGEFVRVEKSTNEQESADASNPESGGTPLYDEEGALGLNYVSYDNVNACFTRGRDRDDKLMKLGLGNKYTAFVIDATAIIAKSGCKAAAPQVVAQPAGNGLGMEFAFGACKVAIGIKAMVANTIRETIFWAFKEATDQEDRLDCGFRKDMFRRTACDLHCLRDLVKAGDKAVLKSLTGAIDVAGKNTDMLLEYYTGGLSDTVTEIQKTQKDFHKQIKKKQAKLAKRKMKTMFTEMRGMLSSRLHPAGRATVVRSLDLFASMDQPSVTNATQSMDNIASEAKTLLDTIRIAASDPLSIAGSAARQTASSLQTMDAAFRKENTMFGIYRDSVHKNRQKLALVRGMTVKAIDDAVHIVQTNELVTFIDISWWAIRAKLDAYLDAADDQAAAFGDAVVVLNDYTSKCTADINDLNRAQSRAAHADAIAKSQLQDTWHSIEPQLGLLVARIVDSDAFNQLAQLDISALDSEASRSTICSGDEAGRSAALTMVDKSLQTGLAYQTFHQLHGVVDELDMLKNRFAVSGLPAPSDETLEQTSRRAITSFQKAITNRSDLAVDMANRWCRPRQLHLDTLGEEPTMTASLVDATSLSWLRSFVGFGTATDYIFRTFLALLSISMIVTICAYHLKVA